MKRKRYYGPAIYKVQEVNEPYSGQYKCLRLLIAIPNMEGTKPYTNEPAPSFRKGYLLYQSSDFHDKDRDRIVAAVLSLFLRSGFTVVEDVDDFRERMLVLMTPSRTEHKTNDEEDAA
jgi:hypothetical protein